MTVTYSIVAPVYNEVESLPHLYGRIRKVMAATGEQWELILVDDGSTDRSVARMQEVARQDPVVRWIAFERNFGQSAALDAGFKAARADLIATMDGDVQNDPADLPQMLALIESGECDCVFGIRQKRQDNWLRKISSKIGNGVRNWLTHESIKDVGCALRLMRRAYLSRVKMYSGMHRFLPTLVRLEGARIREIPVRHHPRTRGKAKYGVWNRMWVGLRDVFAVRWMRDRHIAYRIKSQSE